MMTTIEHITSLDLLQLEPYRTLKQPLEHLQKGIFVAEGEKVVERLLASTIRTYSVLLSDEWFERLHGKLEKHRDMIEVFVGEKRLIDTIVGHRLHQAIMAIGQVPKTISITELCSQVIKRRTFLVVAVDGITNSENMGVIVRNCACFNVDALITFPASCNPYLRRSVRNSMGNIFKMPIVHCSIAEANMQALKDCGIKFYAAHPQSESKNLLEVEFAAKSCIVFGAEGNGISQEMLKLCDEFVTIPMKKGVDSLNVASASAVMLYEINTSRNRNIQF